VNTTHVETHGGTLEDEIEAFRSQLLKRNPDISPSDLRRELGNYTARRKVELGVFYRFDL
jgi:hypothetical protein